LPPVLFSPPTSPNSMCVFVFRPLTIFYFRPRPRLLITLARGTSPSIENYRIFFPPRLFFLYLVIPFQFRVLPPKIKIPPPPHFHPSASTLSANPHPLNFFLVAPIEIKCAQPPDLFPPQAGQLFHALFMFAPSFPLFRNFFRSPPFFFLETRRFPGISVSLCQLSSVCVATPKPSS